VRNRARAVMIYAVAAVLAAKPVHRFHELGGPYFVFPETVQDHVSPIRYPSRDVILLARRAAEIIPRGATVTALQPSTGPDWDVTHWMTAFGMMPRHRVVPPPDLEHGPLPQYVLAVREPFENRKYRLIDTFPEGRIYELAQR
jgi:hypothetical protein